MFVPWLDGIRSHSLIRNNKEEKNGRFTSPVEVLSPTLFASILFRRRTRVQKSRPCPLIGNRRYEPNQNQDDQEQYSEWSTYCRELYNRRDQPLHRVQNPMQNSDPLCPNLCSRTIVHLRNTLLSPFQNGSNSHNDRTHWSTDDFSMLWEKTCSDFFHFFRYHIQRLKVS